MKKLILTNFQSPGDIVMLTAAVRDLHVCHPGRFLTDVRTSCPDLWEHEYPLIHRSNQEPWHFLHGFGQFLADRLDVPLRVTAFKGTSTPFWLITSGGKTDYTIKWWEHARYRRVVDHFRGRIEFVQVGERNHCHPALDGVIDLRGATSLRHTSGQAPETHRLTGASSSSCSRGALRCSRPVGRWSGVAAARRPLRRT